MKCFACTASPTCVVVRCEPGDDPGSVVPSCEICGIIARKLGFRIVEQQPRPSFTEEHMSGGRCTCQPCRLERVSMYLGMAIAAAKGSSS